VTPDYLDPHIGSAIAALLWAVVVGTGIYRLRQAGERKTNMTDPELMVADILDPTGTLAKTVRVARLRREHPNVVFSDDGVALGNNWEKITGEWAEAEKNGGGR